MLSTHPCGRYGSWLIDRDPRGSSFRVFVAGAAIMSAWEIDCFTVSLHSPNGRLTPAIRAVQGDCQWLLKNSGNSHQWCEPTMHWGRKAIPTHVQTSWTLKGWCQPIGGHILYPLDNPDETRLGLCSSLLERRKQDQGLGTRLTNAFWVQNGKLACIDG